MSKCPTCGHTPSAKRQAIAPVSVDVDAMSDAQLRVYRAKTAPYCDVHFMLSCDRVMSDALRADLVALTSTVDAAGRFTKGTTRATFYRAYNALATRKRIEGNAAHWIELMLTRKAAAWADARQADADVYAVALERSHELARKAAEWADARRANAPAAVAPVTYEYTGSSVSGIGYGYSLMRRTADDPDDGRSSFAVRLSSAGVGRIVPCGTWDDARDLGERFTHAHHAWNVVAARAVYPNVFCG